MPSTRPGRFFLNSSARSWVSSSATELDSETVRFHQRLPGYAPTRLIPLDSVAGEIGVGHVLLKDETSRLDLPAFKILGASWATYRAIATETGVPLDVPLERLAVAAKERSIRLFAATDGNHGRAVARMAGILGLKSDIFVPKTVDAATRNRITSEGAHVTVVQGDYDVAVRKAKEEAELAKRGILIQDTAFPGYEDIPQWIVSGYSTMLHEVDQQAMKLAGKPPDLVIVPVGVGSFAQAVVAHYKGPGRSTAVLTVEPDGAACLKKSLELGAVTTIPTRYTIMDGLNCGTVSSLGWPILQHGVDASTSVSDYEAHQAVHDLHSRGVLAGPCGAAPLAALRIAARDPALLGINADSVVVLLCTEGARDYPVPLDVSIDDPVALTQALVRIDSSNPDLSASGGAGESAIADYIAAWLQHRDFEVHVLEATPGRPSVVGVARGSGNGQSLMFNGHIDTVTLMGYEGDPLRGDIVDGSIHGRGAFDMKAGVAASLVAAVNAKQAKLRGDVIVAAVADEENLSLGTEEVLTAGWHADGAVISEPSHLEVTLSHRGFVWFDVDIIGKAAHGSRPELGIDAIVKAGYFLVALDQYGKDLAEGPKHPVLGAGTVHASLIKGGEEPSSYPALCTISIERRTVPGETSSLIETQLRAILDGLVQRVPAFRYALRPGISRPPFEADRSSAFVQSVLEHAEAVLGFKPTIRAEPFWTDLALLAEKGIPAVMFGVDGGGAHAATEWATVESIVKVADTLTRIALDFCA